MNRYRAEVYLTVFFDSETEPGDITDEEIEVRTADAIHAGQILDYTGEDCEWDGPTPTAPTVPTPGEPA